LGGRLVSIKILLSPSLPSISEYFMASNEDYPEMSLCCVFGSL
jgi:hypothetical protein